MSQIDQTIEIINKSLKLSELFVKFHGFSVNNEPMSLKEEEELKIILPFLFFNPSNFYAVAKSPHISFRLSYMKELFEAPYSTNIEKLPDFFEGCKNPSEKITFLYNDLSLIDNGQKPRFLNLLQYAQYISDCLPILYARFSSEFKLSTFMSVAFCIGEMAVKTFCFCFPNVICPVFMTALKTRSAESLLINVCTLSPNHRPILHPKLINYPIIFSLLSIKYFPEEAPVIILSSVSGCYPQIKSELIPLFKPISSSNSYFKLYCRCCSMLASLDSRDYEILKECKDNKLLIATLFNIDQIDSSQNFLGDFLRIFSDDNEAMTFLFELAYDINKDKEKKADVSRKVKEILGEDCDWQIKEKFYNYFCNNFKGFNFKVSYLGKDVQALKLFSWLIDVPDLTCPSSYFSDILKTLTVFDVEVANYITSILDFYKQKKIDEYKFTIDSLVKNMEEVFDLQAIADNAAPAIAATIIILESERHYKLCNQNFAGQFVNELPIRFVVCIVYHTDKFSSIFHYFAKLCNKYAPHVFYQLPLATLSPSYLLSKGDSRQFLERLSDLYTTNQLSLIDEEMYTDWLAHRLKSPFQYAVETIAALGGPSYFEQPHELFKFPQSVYRLKYVLKILFVCFIDIARLYDKPAPINELNKTVPINGSHELLFYYALKLLEDQQVDKQIVCEFLNEILIISPTIMFSFMNQGCNSNLLEIIAKEVPQINNLMLNKNLNIPQLITWYINERRQKNFLFALELTSYLVAANNRIDNLNLCSHLFCTNLLLASINLLINEEIFERVINAFLRIFKVFPSFYPPFYKLLITMKKKVEEFTSQHAMPILDSAIQEISTYEYVL